MNWKYYVNGVEQTFMRRVYPTKTFKAASLVVLGFAVAAVEGKVSVAAAISAAATGAGLVVLRAAVSKVELSMNALNPDLPNVTAAPKN